MSRHIVVVGAGMVGLSTAWHLRADGHSVTVVERSDVAAGSSWGNAGWLAPALTLPLPEPAILKVGIAALLTPSSPVYVPPRLDPALWRFLLGFARHCTPAAWRRAMEVFAIANARALDAFDELAGHTAAPVTEPTVAADPFLAVFASETDRALLADELAHSFAPHRLISGDEARAKAPFLTDQVESAIELENQRFINPGRYVASLADTVRAAGVTIRTGTAVTKIDPEPGAVTVRCEGADGASVEHLSADDVVLANGAWISRQARRFGVRRIVQAGRGYSFTVHPEELPAGPVYFPAQRVACTPLNDGNGGFRVAGMMEFRRADDALDPRRIDAIVAATKPFVSGIDWEARTDEWVGSRPCTTDGIPLVGRTRHPRVWMADGHGMWGVALGPLTGKVLATAMRGQADPLTVAFNPLR